MGGGQRLIQRMLALIDHRDLREQREFDPVGQAAKRLDLVFGPRLLGLEVVGRKTQHFEPLGVFVLVEFFEPFVLRREATLGGDIDHQQHLARVSLQGLRGAIDRSHRDGVESAHELLQQCSRATTLITVAGAHNQ